MNFPIPAPLLFTASPPLPPLRVTASHRPPPSSPPPTPPPPPRRPLRTSAWGAPPFSQTKSDAASWTHSWRGGAPFDEPASTWRHHRHRRHHPHGDGDEGWGLRGGWGDEDVARCCAVLGVRVGAERKEVRAAFRRAAARWHPDRHGAGGEEEARRRFEEVVEAARVVLGAAGGGDEVGEREVRTMQEYDRVEFPF